MLIRIYKRGLYADSSRISSGNVVEIRPFLPLALVQQKQQESQISNSKVSMFVVAIKSYLRGERIRRQKQKIDIRYQILDIRYQMSNSLTHTASFKKYDYAAFAIVCRLKDIHLSIIETSVIMILSAFLKFKTFKHFQVNLWKWFS